MEKTTLGLELVEYHDVIRLGFYYADKPVIIPFPNVSEDVHHLFTLSIASNKDRQVPIVTYPFITIYENIYVCIEAEYLKFSHIYVCNEDSTPGLHQTVYMGNLQVIFFCVISVIIFII